MDDRAETYWGVEFFEPEANIEFSTVDIEELYARLDPTDRSIWFDEDIQSDTIARVYVEVTPKPTHEHGCIFTLNAYLLIACGTPEDSNAQVGIGRNISEIARQSYNHSYINDLLEDAQQIQVYGENAAHPELRFVSIAEGGEWCVETSILIDDTATREEHLQTLKRGVNRMLGGMSIVASAASRFDSDEASENKIRVQIGRPETTGNEHYEAVDEQGPEEETVRMSPFSKFVGMDEIVERLKNAAYDITHPEDLLAYGYRPAQGILLHGESGVGKTALFEAFIEEVDAEAVWINFAEAAHGLVGSWAKSLSEKFDTAFRNSADSDRPIVLVFDEFDGISTSGNDGVNNNISAVLKQKMEEIYNHPNVVVLAATNDISRIDPIVIADKRFPIKIGISKPTEEERKQILRTLVFEPAIKKSFSPLEAFEIIDILDAISWDRLAEITDGFSAGDLVTACESAVRDMFASARKAGRKPGLLSQEVLELAITRMRQSGTR